MEARGCSAKHIGLSSGRLGGSVFEVGLVSALSCSFLRKE